MINKTEFDKIIKVLANCFPRFELTADMLEVYHRMLRDFTVEELQAATLEIAADSTFFPAVSEIRKKVISLRMRAAKIPNAIEAWDELIKARTGEITEVIEENGQYVIEHRKFVFSCPLVEVVARQLGWPRQFPNKESISYERTTFLKAYESELARFVSNELSTPEVRSAIERGDFAKNLHLPDAEKYELLPPPGGYPSERGWTTVDRELYPDKITAYQHE
jgi:hypothetical protein